MLRRGLMMRRAAARWVRRFAGDEQGSVFLIVGTFLILLLFVGMATDFGIVLRFRRAMQNACDSGALAGAQALPAATPAQNEATQYASADMTASRIQWDSLTATAEDVNFQADSVNPKQVQVTIGATVPLFFLKILAPSMNVAVQCAARIVPVTQTGLQPVGMLQSTYTQIQKTLPNGTTNCPYIYQANISACENQTVTDPTTNTAYTQVPGTGDTGNAASDWAMTISTSQTWGSGNTGTLNLSSPLCTAGGASGFACVMENGTGYVSSGTSGPPPYCINATQNINTAPACSLVLTKPGMQAGSANGNTGIRGGISALCQADSGPVDPTTGNISSTAPYAGQQSKWIVTLPLLDPNIWATAAVSGSSTSIDIWGFTAFELDCPKMGNGTQMGSGQTLTIFGRFVSLVTAGVGNPNGPNTGVTTIILVQ